MRASNALRGVPDARSAVASGAEVVPLLPDAGGEAAPARRLRLLSASDIANEPDPEPVVAGMLYRGTMAAIVAPYSSFKSFVALDLALCIATGLDYHGRPVRRGPVVYIAAEGRGGLKKRLAAWCGLNGLRDASVPDIHFVPQSVALNASEDLAELLALVAEMPTPPVAVFIDTVHRTFRGNENDAQDAGDYIRAGDAIRERTGALMLYVHHTGWEGTRSRGSSSLPAAWDTEITLKRDDGQVEVSCSKQKDVEEFAPFRLETVSVAGSLALRPVVPGSSKLTKNEVTALSEVQASEGLRSKAWEDATGLAKGSFHNARRRLLDLGYVKQTKEFYTATDTGRLALSTTVNAGTNEVQLGGSYEVHSTPQVHRPEGCTSDLVPSR
jgi:hypothetical protein